MLDRSLAGRSHDTFFDWFSYFPLAITVLGPLLSDYADTSIHKSGGWLTDFALLAEALAVDSAINQVVKLSYPRARPYAYGLPSDDPSLASPESSVSFYSMHTSLAFTSAAFYTTLFALRHPNNRGAAAAIGILGFAMASSVAVMRIGSGNHFYSDVLIGSLAGSAIGVAVPLSHKKRRLPVSLAPTPGGALLTITFVN